MNIYDVLLSLDPNEEILIRPGSGPGMGISFTVRHFKLDGSAQRIESAGAVSKEEIQSAHVDVCAMKIDRALQQVRKQAEVMGITGPVPYIPDEQLMEIPQPRRHVFYTSKNCPFTSLGGDTHDHWMTCPICAGGLNYCSVCKQAEGELQEICPGPTRCPALDEGEEEPCCRIKCPACAAQAKHDRRVEKHEDAPCGNPKCSICSRK